MIIRAFFFLILCYFFFFIYIVLIVHAVFENFQMKETQESRPRVHNGGSNRGVRVTSEHIAGSCGSTQTSYNGMLNLSSTYMGSMVVHFSIACS